MDSSSGRHGEFVGPSSAKPGASTIGLRVGWLDGRVLKRWMIPVGTLVAASMGLALSACGSSPSSQLMSSDSPSVSSSAPASTSTAAPASGTIPALEGNAQIVLTAGKPSGFDWTTIKAPANGSLRRTVLIAGTGATVTAESTITANYLGAIYGSKTPFDESYTKAPLNYPLADLVQGWQQGLVGLKVGSRVILEIPPALGYGDQAVRGIPANSTLYFVLDILAVS